MRAREFQNQRPAPPLARLAHLWARTPARLRFPATFAGLLALLLAPWPGLGRAFASFACIGANLAGSMLSAGGGSVRFRPEGPPDSWQALLTLVGPGGEAQQALWELRRAPYLPLAVFAAIVLSFPFGEPKRRLHVGVLGLLLLSLLPGLRLLLLVESDGPFRMLEFPSPLRSLLEVACGTLVMPPGMAYALPLLLWLFLLWKLDPAALRAGMQALSEPRSDRARKRK